MILSKSERLRQLAARLKGEDQYLVLSKDMLRIILHQRDRDAIVEALLSVSTPAAIGARTQEAPMTDRIACLIRDNMRDKSGVFLGWECCYEAANAVVLALSGPTQDDDNAKGWCQTCNGTGRATFGALP